MEDVEFCTQAEVETLLKSTKNVRHRAQILLMNDAGLRVTEVCRLKWIDFDFRKKVVAVNSLKKRTKELKRIIPLSDRLYSVLSELLEKYPPARDGWKNNYLFPGLDESKPIGRAAVNNMLKKLQAGNPELPNIHPHKLRHTFATNLRANGSELEDIKDLLGHKNYNTTLIYAHASPEVLRERINASQPKQTFFQRWGHKFFPARRPQINLIAADPRLIVGRESEIKRINELMGRNVSVILTGAAGVGKSHILNNISSSRKILEMDDCKDFKKSVANILLYLFDGDKELISQMIFGVDDKGKIAAKVSKESLNSLCKLLVSSTEKHEYIIKIGDIDNITPSVVKALEILKDHFCVITTARAVKMANTGFMWNFEKLEIKPLNRLESVRLFHRMTEELNFENTDYSRNKVWDTSEGNPRMICELSERFKKESVLSSDVVDEICDGYIGKQTKEIDMSIYFLLLFGGLAVLRYLSAEVENSSLKFIGGCFMILLLFARYFFNSVKRKTL